MPSTRLGCKGPGQKSEHECKGRKPKVKGTYGDSRLKPINSEDTKGKQKIRPPGTPRQDANQQCSREGNGDFDESHLEALINPNRTAIRCKNDQCNHDEKKNERPNVLGRYDNLPNVF